jgi:hypothetical protein
MGTPDSLFHASGRKCTIRTITIQGGVRTRLKSFSDIKISSRPPRREGKSGHLGVDRGTLLILDAICTGRGIFVRPDGKRPACRSSAPARRPVSPRARIGRNCAPDGRRVGRVGRLGEPADGCRPAGRRAAGRVMPVGARPDAVRVVGMAVGSEGAEQAVPSGWLQFRDGRMEQTQESGRTEGGRALLVAVKSAISRTSSIVETCRTRIFPRR